MMAILTDPQHLSARDDGDDSNQGWSPLQIATPAIVGGVLLLIFVAYIVWQRYPPPRRSCDYHQVRSDWVSKIERMFVSRRTRMRVLHSSAPMTLDDSIRTGSLVLDFRRARQYRSDSSDSQTPLTSTNYTYLFDYPPNKSLSDSPPPTANRHPVRWWRFFRSGLQEVKPAEPGSRWRVDGPDGSSTGHGQSSPGHEEYHARYAALAMAHENPEEVGAVIQIGENFASVASTPMTHHFPEQARTAQGMPTVSEYPGTSGARTPVPAASALQSHPGTLVPSVTRGLPPSYDVSQRQTRFASAEDIIHPTRSDSPYMVIPPPLRAAGYSSPRVLHGRELSTDSFLATQSPMLATSIY